MHVLKIFRHGPLLFWSAVSVLFSSVLLLGLDVTDVPNQDPVRSATATWSEVESWRSSLAQLPLLAASGEVSEFARSLASSARDNAATATRSGDDVLASAWVAAAAAAERLAESESEGQGAIQAATRGVGLAGDRLLAAAQGLEWVEAVLPTEIDLAPASGSEESGSADDNLSQ